MRINNQHDTLDMEDRDWNYFMPHYVMSYLYHNRNKPPKEIIFPMFEMVTNPQTKEKIPVRYVPALSPEAIDISTDGSNIPEANEAEIAARDAADDEAKRLRDRIAELEALLNPATEPDEPEPEEDETQPDDFPFEEKEIGDHYEEEQIQEAESAPAFTIGNEPPPAGRTPRLPAKLAEGSPDGMGSRDVGADRQIARDLKFGEDESAPA